MISDIRFVSVSGKTVMEIKKCEIDVDASGAFCGVRELPWESVPTVSFDSIDSYREAIKGDRKECSDALAYKDLMASGGIQEWMKS